MAGDKKFHDMTRRILDRFESRERVYDEFDFFGQHVKMVTPEIYEVMQKSHIDMLDLFPVNGTFESFRSVRSTLSWICITRPDICYAINRAAQVIAGNMCNKDIAKMNAAIRKVKGTPNYSLTFISLELNSLYLNIYVDASFATNKDYTSQLGFVVLLCDKNDRAHFIDFSSIRLVAWFDLSWEGKCSASALDVIVL